MHVMYSFNIFFPPCILIHFTKSIKLLRLFLNQLFQEPPLIPLFIAFFIPWQPSPFFSISTDSNSICFQH